MTSYTAVSERTEHEQNPRFFISPHNVAAANVRHVRSAIVTKSKPKFYPKQISVVGLHVCHVCMAAIMNPAKYSAKKHVGSFSMGPNIEREDQNKRFLKCPAMGERVNFNLKLGFGDYRGYRPITHADSHPEAYSINYLLKWILSHPKDAGLENDPNSGLKIEGGGHGTCKTLR